MPIDLILGTAGHIDHGKTALVRALTGVDTDRLPEEKRRGITIDLGYAELDLGDYRLGVVDVPGHERFIRNMLAGATGVDLALLAVAADDSVKPQTREHLEILRRLDLGAGVIALTKCDLPEPAWIDLVEAEVRELTRDTFLEQAPIVRTSVVQGVGLEELRAALSVAAAQVAERRRQARGGPFRLPIDRSFTLPGHGTIVTGSVVSGGAKIGDELVLEPGARSVRVRGLHSHDRPVDEVHAGQRAAVNLAGVHHEEIARGHELAAPEYLVPSRLLTVRLEVTPDAPRPLRHRQRLRVHLGTADVLGSLSLLGVDEVPPGESALAQLFLAEPVVATWGQAFIVREESPPSTLGGGRVLDPAALKLRRRDANSLDWARRLESSDSVERASAALYFFGLRAWRPTDLVRAAGVFGPEPVVAELHVRGELVHLVGGDSRFGVHRARLAELAARLEGLLTAWHQRWPLALGFDPKRLAQQLDLSGGDSVAERLVEPLLERMALEGRIVRDARGVALSRRGPQLSPRERELLESIVERFREAGFQPPSVDELRSGVTRNQAAVPALVKLAAGSGLLIEFAPGMYLHAEMEQVLRRRLTDEFAQHGSLTVSQIRETLGTTRKFAVPLCEYLDRSGFTRREGDLRLLADPPSAAPRP